MDKYFMHRIQKENGAFSKGIEIHDTLDSAVRSFWGRMKLAYGKNAAISFMHCKITDSEGNTVKSYDMIWKSPAETENMFFLHHIRLDDATFSKDIDTLESYDTARGDFAGYMEYGYSNPNHPKVSFIHNQITDMMSNGAELMTGVWVKPEETVEPEEAAD